MEESFNIARPYAKAVFTLAVESNKLQEWSELLTRLSATISNIKVMKFLTDPRHSWYEYADLFAGIGDKLVDNFMRILAYNRRLLLMPAIAVLYEQMRLTQEKIVSAEIISAIELSTTEQQKLQNTLNKRLKSTISLSYKINKSLLGGMVIRIGDHVIDNSIAGKLHRLRKILRS